MTSLGSGPGSGPGTIVQEDAAPEAATLVALVGREAPTGAIVEIIDLPDRARLRTARWLIDDAVGTVLICTGRGEFIEKYFEVARDLLDRRLAVVVFDWRGQGLSSRSVANRRKGHVRDFAAFGRDLEAVVDRVLKRHCPGPFFALAHSMGGTVMLHHAVSRTCRFSRIVLSAPMIEIERLPFRPLIHRLSRGLTSIGLGRFFVPQGGRTAVFSKGFKNNVLTTDRRRFEDMMAISLAEPRLTIDAPTIGWLAAALDAMAPFTDPEFTTGLVVPVMIVVPGDDRVVNVAAMERFGARLKGGTIVSIPGARHEILMERDSLREQFWAAFDAFVPGRSSVRPTPLAAVSAGVRR